MVNKDILPGNQGLDLSFLTKDSQAAVSKNPDLLLWRDQLIEEQVGIGFGRGMFYSSFATPRSTSNYFAHLPHTIAGWSIAALSPEDSLLKIKGTKGGRLPEDEMLENFVIDPFRLPEINLAEISDIHQMRLAIRAKRTWLMEAKGVKSGKIAVGENDGGVCKFLGYTESLPDTGGKRLPITRAKIMTCGDIFSAADSLHHGADDMHEDAQNIGATLERYAAELHRIITTPHDQGECAAAIDAVVTKIQASLKQTGHVFAIKKAILDYLIKLCGSHHDTVRAIQCLRWISEGHRDRLEKGASLEYLRTQTIAFLHAHRLEWQNLFILDGNGRINIVASLANAAGDNQRFTPSAEAYGASETSHVPQPFFGFREEWKHITPETSPEYKEKLLLKQFSIVLLSTIKTMYGYQDTNWNIPNITKKRIEELRYIWPTVYSESSLPEIRYDSQENFVADLKKMIQFVKEV